MFLTQPPVTSVQVRSSAEDKACPPRNPLKRMTWLIEREVTVKTINWMGITLADILEEGGRQKGKLRSVWFPGAVAVTPETLELVEDELR